MFRVLDVGREGSPRVTEGQGDVGPPPEGTLRWIDVEAQSAEELAILGERFRFHPLALEDCAHFGQRPKLEEYDGYMFVVTHAFALPADQPLADLEPRELHAFLGSRYLVTVHSEAIEPLAETWKRIGADPALARRGIDFAYYLLADAVADANFPLLDRISDELDEIEDGILAGAGPEVLAPMFRLKRTLTTMRRVLSPQRDTFGALTKRGSALVSERTALYFRDVYDHLVRINESIEAGRDILGNAMDAYLTMVSNRTNEIMKRLTIMSAIFLPLTFVTGFFGQNFQHLPFGSDALMFAMIAACLALPIGMLWWFKRSKWF